MVTPNKHGINKVNLKLPKDGWRLIVLFRNLRPVIKKQIEHHRQKCNNEDTNPEVMKLCQCHKIK